MSDEVVESVTVLEAEYVPVLECVPCGMQGVRSTMPQRWIVQGMSLCISHAQEAFSASQRPRIYVPDGV